MIDEFIRSPLKELQEEAFKIRKARFGNELTFSLPSVATFQRGDLQNNRFSAVSVTGKRCDLQCVHCKGTLLDSMVPAENPDAFLQIVERLRARGALGMLVSGGQTKRVKYLWKSLFHQSELSNKNILCFESSYTPALSKKRRRKI